MNSPARQQHCGSPPPKAKDVDTYVNSPPSREKAIQSLSPSGIMKCAEMLAIDAANPIQCHRSQQRKIDIIKLIIDRVLSFTYNPEGSCPSHFAAPGYNGPLYVVELCSPSRVVLLTGWKAQVEHAYRAQQANMLWKHAFTEDGSLKDNCKISDMKKAVGTIMNKLITDEEMDQWFHLTERPILMPEYTEELQKIRKIRMSAADGSS